MSTTQDPNQPISNDANGASVARNPSVAIGRDPKATKEPSTGQDSPLEDVKEQPIAEVTKQEQEQTQLGAQDDGWLPAVDEPVAHKAELSTTGAHVRTASVMSKRSLFTNREGDEVEGSTFIRGAATNGPQSTHEPNDGLNLRVASADASLTPKQKSRISKQEAKDGKSLAKVIKQEGKAEKKAMSVAIKELSELQKIQATVIKREAKAHTAHTKSLAEFQKNEAAFLAARSKYEQSQTKLASDAETLEVTRNNAREATEKLQEKSVEVESLRTVLAVDEREREVKLVGLTGRKSGSIWRR